MDKKAFTTKEAAAELGVTPRRVRQLFIVGENGVEKFGRDLLIPIEAIDAAKNRKTTPGPVKVGSIESKAGKPSQVSGPKTGTKKLNKIASQKAG